MKTGILLFRLTAIVVFLQLIIGGLLTFDLISATPHIIAGFKPHRVCETQREISDLLFTTLELNLLFRVGISRTSSKTRKSSTK